MSGTNDKTVTATEIRVTPPTETITRAPGVEIVRYPTADLFENNVVVPHGGIFTLVSATPPPPGLIVRTNPGNRMNGYVQFKLTSTTRIIAKFTPHPPFAHLTGLYTLAVTMSKHADEDDSSVKWAFEEHYDRP